MQRTLIGLNSGRINTREGFLSRVDISPQVVDSK
jgi:hypothetical protein